MGGYVSLPSALAAKILNIKLIVHEQNSIPGLTNKILSFISDQNFSAFPNSLRKSKIIGNPYKERDRTGKKPKKKIFK